MAAMRRRFRRHRAHSTKKIPPIAIVGIVLLLAIIITLIVGNLLRSWLDDDTHQAMLGEEEEIPEQEVLHRVKVRNVHAYPFSLGGDLNEIAGQTSASVLLNTPTGTVTYTSPVGQRYSLPSNNPVTLEQSMLELGTVIPYVSGVFYPQAVKQENPMLRYAATAEECALLHEFISSGGSELLIAGLSWSSDQREASVAYLTAVKKTAGEIPVGVAIPASVVADQANWELLERLMEVVDFCALDFTAHPINTDEVDEMGVSVAARELFIQYDYYLSGYSMRPLFAQSQEALIIASIATDRPTFQVIREATN